MRSRLDSEINILLSRISELGNHHKKYIFTVEKHFSQIVNLTDEKGLSEQFNLLRFSYTPEKQMRLLNKIIEDKSFALDMLGCYFALQFLMMNLKAMDVLALDLFTEKNIYKVFRSFLYRTGNDFRLLSGAYMTVLFDIYLPRKQRPQFVLCGVGTRVDQDDIDIGVIDVDSDSRGKLNEALASLNTEMLKHASALHFHLSEHVGKSGFTASIEEYHDLLDNEICDFVILSEMLNAVPILGRLKVFSQFRNEILDRYYYRHNNSNKYHEGYLRGLLGEMRDLLMRDPPDDVLNPKDDGLRMIKGVISALKTWKGVRRPTSFEVLEVLMKWDHANIDHYNRIYHSLMFLETFRFLYQIYIVQEDEIILNEGIVDNLSRVAYAMGYHDNNFAPASTQLLIHYQDHLKVAKLGAEALIRQITKHLIGITIFYPIVDTKTNDESVEIYKGNFSVDLIRYSRFFRGTRFWDDILSLLNRDDETLLNRFLNGFSWLSERERDNIIRAYVKWISLSPYTLISLITLIVKHKPEMANSKLIRDFVEIFIMNIEQNLENIRRLSQAAIFYPQIMNKFLSILTDNLLFKLMQILDHPVWKPEVNRMREKFLALCKLHYNSSYYFKRFVLRVFNSNPDFITSITNPARFRNLADGLFQNLENFVSVNEKLSRLGSFYDFEFMRLGINAINGMPFTAINQEFTYFCDNYIQVLYDLCKEIALRSEKSEPETKDLLAIFVAGGHGRSQAFEDDYDLIILLNSDDREIVEFANKIVIKMNWQINKRYITPPYRFADRFGSYITTTDDLKALFKSEDEDQFIDKSQLLGSRMVVGSRRFESYFRREIIGKHIFNKKDEFITSLLNEISSRRSFHRSVETIEIKEGPGGLRDLENFLFILKAHFKLYDPISVQLFNELIIRIDSQRQKFQELMEDYDLLKCARDLYHLIVSNHDEIRKEYLDKIIEPLGRSLKIQIDSTSDIENMISSAMVRIVDNIEAVLNHLGYSTAK